MWEMSNRETVLYFHGNADFADLPPFFLPLLFVKKFGYCALFGIYGCKLNNISQHSWRVFLSSQEVQIVKKNNRKKKINVKKRKNPKEATAEGNRRGMCHRGGRHPPWEVSVVIRSSIQCREKHEQQVLDAKANKAMKSITT